VFLFLFSNFLDSKDLSCNLQTSCVISFYFQLYLMLHACVVKFNMTENLKKFLRSFVVFF
jgi:hypothetical protein